MQRWIAAAFSLALTASAAAQERDFSQVEIRVEKVAGSVYMLSGEGGNIGVSVGEDGVLVVDDQFAPLVPKIEAAIRSVTDRPVRFVLNTHWHFDHTGGNEPLGRKATLVAHANVRQRLLAGDPDFYGRKLAPAPPAALPVITFDESLSLHLNGEEIRALHYAKGHTDGDSIIFFRGSKVVHMGDDFVTYGFPFVDVRSGGSLLGLIEAAEQAMAAVPDDVRVIPGHGPLSTKSDVAKFTSSLRDCVALVRAAKARGMTLEQMQAENVLSNYDAMSGDFVKAPQFIELIYRELEGEAAKTSQPSPRHH